MFVKYKNYSGKSSISSYEIGDDYIAILFDKTKRIYKYSYSSAGDDKVERMKSLALQGYGLNSFVIKNCNNLYVK